MKQFLIVLTVIGTSIISNPVAHATGNPSESDSIRIVQEVIRFFKAFDERDLKALEAILAPTSTIVHHNGVTTSKDEMLQIIKETKTWLPRQRHLSGYELIAGCDLFVVGFINDVTFTDTKNKKTTSSYVETWIFKKMGTQWHPVRIAYAKVTANKHTEGSD